MIDDVRWLIETRDLTRVYGDGQEIRALDGVTLTVELGEFVAVMGPSGSGKSTLLNMIGALDVPTSGQVLVKGSDLAEVRDIDTFRARTVGFVFQMHNLLPTLTSRENVEVPMVGQLGSREKRERASELLALVGLEERMDHLPNMMSGGERQRIAIARALANNPSLVLADEPTGNLDTATGRELMALLRRLNADQGTTLLVVTHDPAVARQTNRVIVMADGKVLREDLIGSPLEEDLKMWRYSGLGRRVAAGEVDDLEGFSLGAAEMKALQKLLGRAETA
ncbi:MAG: ABC transporter ATP-binding protein [Anaerolineales bacterium]